MNESAELRQLLIKYWGHSSFRPLQQEIIESVVAGFDTLALLPTGGGKSVCFQLPAIVRGGVCIVVSPLIALMKDQVENLNQKGISAKALYTGMHRRELDISLDEAVNGDIQFLYLSPERLQTDMFLQRLPQMPLKTIAVDEAHCISQWGYDFRPPYIQIADIRPVHPDVPVIALTATATPEVVKDIMDKLAFRQETVFSKSFARDNLVYLSINEENKYNRVLRVCRKINGSGIIYARNRKLTEDLAAFLNKNNIKASFYHAGLTPELRDKRQEEWIKGYVSVVVSTNAFGMGIDKPDVRYVIHIDIPDSPEAYFQEAGRGGRDGKKSYAVLLYEKADIIKAKTTFEQSWPEIKEIKMVYNALGNFMNLAVGAGRYCSFDFDLQKFASQYNRSPRDVYFCIKAIEQQGYVTLNEGYHEPSKLMIKVSKEELYRFQVKNLKIDPFIRLLLRSYSGIFSKFVIISEENLAYRAKTSIPEVLKILEYLEQSGLIDYQPRKTKPQIYFNMPRQDIAGLSFDGNNFLERKKSARKRLEVMIKYSTANSKCRSLILLEYFGEKGGVRCGECDVCQKRNKIELSNYEFDSIIDIIKPILKYQSCTLEELMGKIPDLHEDKLKRVLSWLLDNEKVIYDNDKISWNK